MPQRSVETILRLAPSQLALAAGADNPTRLRNLLQVRDLVSAAIAHVAGDTTELQSQPSCLPVLAQLQFQRRQYSRRFTAFYSFYCPEKVSEVEAMIDKRRGDPERLLQMWKTMISKYGSWPPQDGDSPRRPSLSGSTTPQDGDQDSLGSGLAIPPSGLRRRISQLLSKSDTEKPPEWTREEDNRRRELSTRAGGAGSPLTTEEAAELAQLNEGFARFEQEGMERIRKLGLAAEKKNHRRDRSSTVAMMKSRSPISPDNDPLARSVGAVDKPTGAHSLSPPAARTRLTAPSTHRRSRSQESSFLLEDDHEDALLSFTTDILAPGRYVVDAKPGILVRQSADPASEELCPVPFGEEVEVLQVIGHRAELRAPSGWVTTHDRIGGALLRTAGRVREAEPLIGPVTPQTTHLALP